MATPELIAGFSKRRRLFSCVLCGHVFIPGDTARWIYANFAGSPVNCGNFFVCQSCDAADEIILQCAKIGYEDAVKKAKQWNIYGPDWQSDFENRL